MSDKMRLFAAFDVPESDLNEIQQRVVTVLRPLLPDARWTDPAGQHVTLKFLGWVQSDMAGAIQEACAAASRAGSPWSMQIEGLGAFPSERRARVLWAGIDDPEGSAARLAAALNEAMEPLGFPSEERTFAAHLTLARFRTPARLEEPLLEVEVPRLKPFVVEDFSLFRSYPQRSGSRYERVRRFPLG